MIKSLRCVSCSFLCLFLARSLVWECPSHSFPNFDLGNLLLQLLHRDEERKWVQHASRLFSFYMFWDTFQCHVKNKIAAGGQMCRLNAVDWCWRPDGGEHRILCGWQADCTISRWHSQAWGTLCCCTSARPSPNPQTILLWQGRWLHLGDLTQRKSCRSIKYEPNTLQKTKKNKKKIRELL